MGIWGVTQSELDSAKREMRELATAFEEEIRREIQQKISVLEEEIKRKATDSEEIARSAANNALTIEEKIRGSDARVEEMLTALDGYRNDASDTLAHILEAKKSIDTGCKDLLLEIKNVVGLYDAVNEKKEAIESAAEEVQKNIETINVALTASQSLPEQVDSTQKLLDETVTLHGDMKNLLSHSMKRKSDIDELYNKIHGYEIKNNEGDAERVDGLKDELEKSYSNLNVQAGELDTVIQKLVDSITARHDAVLGTHEISFENLVSDSNKRIAVVNEQLTSLLPGAMAEGLSAAYEKKKEDEIGSQSKYEENFKAAIRLMILISLIPFCVDIYLLGWKDAELIKVIKDTPSLIIAIFPLYFPVLWQAFSTNKKLNLSKRLIEEYTHKAVLGKTFSGLSNQIETLPQDSEVKGELRTRLLFNLLQVSSENPGKLITDYNKSDHPLMEALENSAKLADSVTALSKVPGFSAIASKLATRSEELLKAETEKVKSGLAAQKALEGDAG